MPFLAQTFIILAALNQNVFYISHPTDVSEAFVCFDFEVKNATCEWPKNWHRLTPNLLNGQTPVMESNINRTVNWLTYKLRLIFSNRSHGDSKDWSVILSTSSMNDFINKSCQLNNMNYIEIGSILLIIFVIFTIIMLCIKINIKIIKSHTNQ